MICAGLGFNSAVCVAQLEDIVAQVAPDILAVLASKSQIAEFTHFRRRTPLTIVEIQPGDIDGIDTLTCSPRIKARFGTGSVAEALALVVARRHSPQARLCAPRQIGPDGTTTLALAETY